LREQLRAAGMAKFRAKPVVVIASYVLEGDEHRREEDFAATCCAIQNIQLAAWAEGVGVQWSSNALTQDPNTYTLVGIDPERERIIGFLYVGYPAEIPTRTRRSPHEVIRQVP
jgi:nitroreductase